MVTLICWLLECWCVAPSEAVTAVTLHSPCTEHHWDGSEKELTDRHFWRSFDTGMTRQLAVLTIGIANVFNLHLWLSCCHFPTQGGNRTLGEWPLWDYQTDNPFSQYLDLGSGLLQTKPSRSAHSVLNCVLSTVYNTAHDCSIHVPSGPKLAGVGRACLASITFSSSHHHRGCVITRVLSLMCRCSFLTAWAFVSYESSIHNCMVIIIKTENVHVLSTFDARTKSFSGTQ